MKAQLQYREHQNNRLGVNFSASAQRLLLSEIKLILNKQKLLQIIPK